MIPFAPLYPTNTCQVSSTVINLNHRLSRLITEMAVVWQQLQKANLLFGQIVDLNSFSGCLHETDVSFETLMLIPQDDLAFCKKGLMVHKRHIRSISIGSFLLGEGSSILDLQTSLHSTIEHFNQNFHTMEDFDNEVISSLTSIQNDIEKIASEDINLHDGYLSIKQELAFVKNHFYFLTLKTQHVKAIEDILVKSDLHENMRLLERALTF